MIVIDTTVLADLLLGNEDKALAVKKLIVEDPVWLSVSLWRYEFGNVVWKNLKFGTGSNFETLSSLLGIAEKFLEETVEVNMENTLMISSDNGLTFYDASYVSLTRLRNLKLRTRDAKILRLCSDVALPMPLL